MIHIHSTYNLNEALADIEKLKSHIETVSDKFEYYVDKFIEMKNRNKISGSEKDLYFWLKKPPEDFIDFIDAKLSEISKTELKKNIKLAGAELVIEDNLWRIYKISSHDACRYYGRNTKWCITEESDFYWRRYLLQGYRFYFAIRLNPQNDSFDKLAFQCRGKKIEKVWDSTDISYNIDDLPFLKLPDLSYELYLSNKSKRVGKGLIETPHNILRINKLFVDDKVHIPNSISAIPYNGFAKTKIKEVYFEDNSALKSIYDGTFFNCSDLTIVDLPEGLKKLCRGAFHSCNSLKVVDLPNSLLSIGPYCFADCDSMKSITIPKSVKNIDEGAFKNCIELADVLIRNSNTVIADNAFENCPKINLRYTS